MDLLEAANQSGVALLSDRPVGTAKGRKEWAGSCPYCSAGKDRFRMWPEDRGGAGSFWCRQCGKTGDLIQLLVDHCSYTYPQAFEAAGRSMPDNYRPAGYKAVTEKKPPQFEPRHYEDPVETWQARAQDLADESHQALLKHDKIMAWLDARGLDEKAVRNFRLGWFPGENGKPMMFRPRQAWGLPKEVKENGRQRMLMIPRGIVIPCFKNGRVYRVRIRRPAADLKTERDVKYYVIAGSGMDAMTINPDKKTQVIVESELDAMMVAAQAGSLTGVVSVGSATKKPGAEVYYRLKKTVRILVSLDHDKAGQVGWKWWKQQFSQARLHPVPVGKDPGEAFQQGVDIKAWVSQGLPPVATIDYKYTPPENLYPIEELKILLGRYPVQIRAEPEFSEIIFDHRFKNQAIRNRIRELFEDDDEVHWYLRLYHPDSVITGDNCEAGRY
jgi:hypothetical protein